MEQGPERLGCWAQGDDGDKAGSLWPGHAGMIDLPEEPALSSKSNASPFFSTLVALKQTLFAQTSQCSAPKTAHTPRQKSCRHNLGLSRWI